MSAIATKVENPVSTPHATLNDEADSTIEFVSSGEQNDPGEP